MAVPDLFAGIFYRLPHSGENASKNRPRGNRTVTLACETKPVSSSEDGGAWRSKASF
ncbi:MAG: hypothetical protein J0H18_05340 [Rhizobiales bacterium]|nr:hypothetical protein [Hyphomicrobiales bacterium]